MQKRFALATVLGFALAAIVATAGSAAPKPSSPTSAFSNDVLRVPLTDTFSGVQSQYTGDSEPAISFGDGRVAVDGLSWIPEQVNLWSGTAGSVPSIFGAMDRSVPLNGNGRFAAGDGDADVDLASTGTTHLADLIILFTPTGRFNSLGVSVDNCPATATGPAGCTSHLLDTAGADRPWITSNGSTVWVSYHDAGDSTLIHVQRSTDDGNTWTKVGSPIPGQGAATGDATFNNDQGPIVADPTTGNLLDVYAAGEAGIQKGTTADFNNIYVSRSTNGGNTWSSQRIFHAPLFHSLNNIFPSLAVDPVTGYIYVVWTDQHGVWLKVSTDHGVSFSQQPLEVSSIATTLMPWVAADNHKVDVVYYGTASTSKDDPSAIWNTYDAQSFDDGLTFNQVKVSQTPNHIGGICTNGAGCRNQLVTRTLLDLFEVAENPSNSKASVIYTDDTLDSWTLDGTTYRLPEVVFAQEN